jgi:hypothetical protein
MSARIPRQEDAAHDVLVRLCAGNGFVSASRTTKVQAEFAASPLYVIGREALIANKRASARAKDLLDVALLERSPATIESKKRRHPRAPRGGSRSVVRKPKC